jgi:hypothetical protein
MPNWIRLDRGTRVRHRDEGFEGIIAEGLTELCNGPKRNPDGKTQYRIKVAGVERLNLAAECDLVVLRGSPQSRRTFSVYVALLEDVPNGSGNDVYVGMTGLTPEERFENHKRGYKAGKKWVTKYGVRLLPELYEHLNPLSREDADLMEKETLPNELRRRGYKVYGAH